ncbi:MAG: hypothetical protein [Caudoviricetes sp.]|nr:MAG: hypothetical protein [Caudoviricetes sp.]
MSKITKVWQMLELLKRRVNNSSSRYKEVREYGICYNVSELSDQFDYADGDLYYEWRRHKEKAFEAWGKYSWCEPYPIPACEHALAKDGMGGFYRDPGEAFDYANWKGMMWNKRSEYGRTRHELLDHLINWFKEKDI